MLILRIVGFGLTAMVLLVLLRKERPELAVILSLAAGVLIFLIILPQLASAIRLLQDLSVRAGVRLEYLDTLLKIIGIAYLAEFAAQVCRDAGESSIGTKIEVAGKVLILLLALPIVSAILDIILRLVR